MTKFAQHAHWAHDDFEIRNDRAYSKIMRLIQQRQLIESQCSASQWREKMTQRVQKYELELHLNEWVYEMWSSAVLLTDDIM